MDVPATQCRQKKDGMYCENTLWLSTNRLLRYMAGRLKSRAYDVMERKEETKTSLKERGLQKQTKNFSQDNPELESDNCRVRRYRYSNEMTCNVNTS